MKVLFVNPATKFNARNSGIPLGIIAIATYLKEKGHIIKIVDRTLGNFDVVKAAEEFAPDIIGISVVGYKSAPDAEKISKKLKELNYTVAWGGPFAACAYDIVFASELADYVFSGEGELSWEELLEALEGKNGRKIEDVDGVYCYIDGKLHFNGQHALADLSTFPVMDFSLVNPADYFQENFGCKKMLHLCSAKGCPNHCAFCYNHEFNLSVYRKRPLEDVFSEIDYLSKNYGLDGIYFTDELWASTREELKEFCTEFISRGYNITWGCQTTADRFTREDYELMYKAGCRWLFFGIETGSERMLKKVGKKLDLEKSRQSIISCREVGIVSIVAFIVGFPEETEEDIRLSVEFADSIPASYYSVNFYDPCPGSALCNKIVREGIYTVPKTITEKFNARGIETLQKGISPVKPLDLNVIKNYYMWHSLTGTGLVTVNFSSAFNFAKKVVIEAVESTMHHGVANFVSQFFYDVREVLTLAFYAFCFPGVKKKYGIGKNKKK